MTTPKVYFGDRTRLTPDPKALERVFQSFLGYNQAMILLIDNFDSFTHNLWQWLQAEIALPVSVHRNTDLRLEDIDWATVSGIVLSPGPGNAYTPADLGVCVDILAHCPPTIPLLGVCLGMQAMVVHHTSATPKLEKCPTAMHGKTSIATQTSKESWLLKGISENFTVMRYHSWAVSASQPILPYKPVASADGWLMAMEHSTFPWAGVQFHPESIGTPEGRQILRNFLARCNALNCAHSQPLPFVPAACV